jgi:Domain of unknown function (DUF5664)
MKMPVVREFTKEERDQLLPQQKDPAYKNTADELKKKMQRVPLQLVCPAGIIHEAQAMRDGRIKYGYASYLNADVQITMLDCIGAAQRHLERLKNGEDLSPDAKVHHAGHARAMLGILLECLEAGKLVDDRHSKRDYIGPLLDRLAKENAT